MKKFTWLLVLLGIFMMMSIPAISQGVCDECGTSQEVVPVETSSVDTTYDTEIINESGNVVYIITEGGDVSNIKIGGSVEPEEPAEETEEQGETIEPQCTYGVLSDKWWTGIVIHNPYGETKTGLLKIGNKMFNITAPAGGNPIVFNIDEWVSNEGRYTISLWSEYLVLEAIIGSNNGSIAK